MRTRIGAHQALFDKIDHIYSVTKALPQNSDTTYIVAELCKYCCILASAAMDVCLEDCLLEYSEKSNDQRTIAFIKDRLGRSRNPTLFVIGNVLSSFDPNWKDQLERFADQKIRSDVGSIVTNRNEIAHGRNSQVSFGRLIPWVKTAKALCDKIEQIVFP
jgi:hypothetical protein